MSEANTRWGVLYCPKAHASKQREKIQHVLDERNVSYDFVQSETTDSVERLMNMLIHNGYKTIIIVGGDSALNDAVNCLMQVEKQVRDEIALGVIPNGVSWLVSFAIGFCINVGLIADVMNLRRQTHSLLGSRTLSFIVSIFLMIFHRMDYKMHVRINSDTINRKVMNMCVGSGPGYGQTPSAVPYNGMLDVSVVYHPELLQLFAGFWLLLTGRFLNHRSVHPYRTREVVVEESNKAMVSVDGRLLGTPVGSYRITVEQEVINFLIPD